MIGYNTVCDGNAELEIKRSRFIAYVKRIESEEEAVSFIASLRKKHYDARHVCYAYVADENGVLSRFSDDGEPSGTAGKPILDVIKNNGLRMTLIAVVRYFGGILLGAGGLTRAYSDSAALGVKTSGTVFMEEVDVYRVRAGYPLYKKITSALKNHFEIIETEYGDCVTVTLICEKEFGARKEIENISAGKLIAEYLGTKFAERKSV